MNKHDNVFLKGVYDQTPMKMNNINYDNAKMS